MRTPQWNRLAAVVAATALAGVAACGSADEPAALTGPAGPTASPSADAAKTADAKQAALKSYAGYLAASRRAEQQGDPFIPDLRRYVADPLLTQVRLAVRKNQTHGAIRQGSVRSDPEVTTVNLDTNPATVEIQDCLDTSGYRLVFRRNSAPVPDAAGGRYLVTATATRYPDGRWLINSGTTHQDQPC